MLTKKTNPQTTLIVLLAVALVVAIAFAIFFGVRKDRVYPVVPPSNSVEGAYWKAAVTTNGRPCAPISVEILQRGGSAVEAAVAAIFCDGVTNPHSMGIGGGFLMTIYERAKRTAITLIARETAPAAATVDMYSSNFTLMEYGGLASAVPGQLLGLWEAAERFKSNNVTWRDLIMPTVHICEEGFPVTAYVAESAGTSEFYIRASDTLSEILLKEDGSLLKEGDLMRRPKLAKTLRIIAEEGVSAFYGGDVGRRFAEDVRQLGGIITENDLRSYKVKWLKPVSTQLSDGHTLHTVQLPGSGPLLTFIVNILDAWIPTTSLATTWQRIVEALKFAFGRRTQLGDPDFVDVAELVSNLTSREYAIGIRSSIRDYQTSQDPGYYGSVLMLPDNEGTAHICVLAPNGDAVSVTSSLNMKFGARVRSRSTGIILNSQMGDFSAPNFINAHGVLPSPSNYVAPGKRPISSMCPAIVVDTNGDVRLITGAAGGTRITSSTALAIVFGLTFNKSPKKLVDLRRLHHPLYPMKIFYEPGFDANLIRLLQSFGHVTEEFRSYSSFVHAIAVNRSAPYQQIFANSDFRRLGVVAGY